MSQNLKGRRVLVTGGATGIGASISHALLREGAIVAVAQRTDLELRDALHGSLLEGQVVGVVADLAEPDGPEAAIDLAIRRLGGLDALVNNAAVTGPAGHRMLLDADSAYVEQMLFVNLGAAILCSVAAGRHFISNGGGTIVNIASVLAHVPAPSAAVYSASKAGLLGFTKGAALELGQHGVRVVAVSPGDIDTPSSVSPAAPAGLRPVHSAVLGRRGSPEDVARAVCFLVGDGATYLTGIEVVVDGGFLLT